MKTFLVLLGPVILGLLALWWVLEILFRVGEVAFKWIYGDHD